MLVLLAAATVWPPHVWWWSDFQRAYQQCGIVFNVDGPGPAGDGVLIENDGSGLTLSRNRRRPAKPIQCIGVWASQAGLKVRYRNF